MGPHPVMATLLAAMSPASTVCTALPSGSRIDAYSLRDGRIELPDVGLGDDDVLGEGAVGVDADDLHVLADVRLAGAALQALAAGDVHLGGDEVAFLHAGDIFADGLDGAAELVAGNERGMNAALRPLVPLIDVQVGAANGRDFDLDQDFVRTECGIGNFADLCARSGLRLYDSKHGI